MPSSDSAGDHPDQGAPTPDVPPAQSLPMRMAAPAPRASRPDALPSSGGTATPHPPAQTVIPIALGLLPIGMGLATGSYFATTWMAVGIALAAVLLVVRIAAGGAYAGFRRTLPRSAWVAAALFCGLALFTLLSSAWASDKGAAVEEGTRATMYFLLFLVALGGIGTTHQARLFMTAYTLGAGAVALGVMIALSSSVSPQDFFGEIKLAEPIGYSNAQGSFLLMPALLAIHLASRRSTRTTLRPVFLVAGLVLLQAGVLTQSRGAFWAAIAAIVVYLAIVPDRPRALLWWAVTLALLAAAFPYLNALQTDLADKDYLALSLSVHEMVRAVVASLLAGAAVAALLAWLDTRIVLPRAGVWAARALALLAVVAVLVALVHRFPQLEDPIDAGRTAWDTFKGEEPTPHPDSTIRLLDLDGTYRYELWQVAWATYRAHPAVGIGADNYPIEWVRLRPLLKDVRQPHNLYLRLLAETGIVGLGLFAGGTLLTVGAALSRTARRRHHDRSLVAASIAAASLFLIHASVEWVWHVPAVGAAFFLVLGVLAGTPAATPPRDQGLLDDGENPADRSRRSARPPRRRPSAPTPLTVAAATGCVVLILAAPQVVSLRLTDQATSLFALGQYDRAVNAASWAARLNPLQEEPLVIKGRALAERGDQDGMEATFAEAVDRHPKAWLTYVRWARTRESLGLDPEHAYREAARLNPLAPELQAYRDPE